MKIVWCLLLIGVVVEPAVASRILVLYPNSSKSHLVVLKVLTKELARRGHEVTVVSQFPLDKPMKNYRDVKITSDKRFMLLINEFMDKSGDLMASAPLLPKFVEISSMDSAEVLHNPEFQKIMKEESFDLVIFGYFLNNFLLGVADHFKCPQIAFSTALGFDAMRLIGNPTDLSSVPNMGLIHKGYMNFRLRFRNFVGSIFNVVFDTLNHRWQKKLYEKYFPADRYVSYDEIHQNISLVLINTYFSQDQVRPLVPGMIEVGGLQIEEPKALPKIIQEWMDGAEHGVIFFSLGSNAKSIFFPKEVIEIIMTTFAKLKERVIFKWEADELPGKPDNVMVAKWLPQMDILAHPKTKLFISHCGLGSAVEALFFGVPVIGMPLWGDQMTNVAAIVAEGWGLHIPAKGITKENFPSALKEILENPKYRNKAKEMSDIFRDRPQSPLETAVFWIEYVIRHRGAKHIQYPGIYLNFIQRNSLDVLAFLIAILYLVKKIVGFLFRLTKKLVLKIVRLVIPSKSGKLTQDKKRN